jgi:Tfp pilus assembly protein PilX
MISSSTVHNARERLKSEDGFSILIALAVLAVTTLLATAGYVAVGGDVHLSQHDLDAKRALYAARAGMSTYMYQLNQNPNAWQTCANDSQGSSAAPTAVPGSTTGEQYSYSPVLANGSTSCTSNSIGNLIDNSTGTLRMAFVGYAGRPRVSRGIVASFRRDSPLDFLWFTVFEALDSSIDSSLTQCNQFYRPTPSARPSACNINFVSGDVLNGPMYTQDQYLISGSPTFGRTAKDRIESAATGTSSSTICTSNNCGSAIIKGTATPNAPVISPPPNNSVLLTDAQTYGQVFSGTTTITLNGSNATVVSCPLLCTTTQVDVTQNPIIYVSNASGCPTPPTYSPFTIVYLAIGCTGDVYVSDATSATYTAPLTIAAANDIIITGPLVTSEDGSGAPIGGAALGLVANRFVRVQHGVTARGTGIGLCTGPPPQNTATTNVLGQSTSNLKVDAAILALQHSFIVDNFDCGATLGNLTINGAIAQNFRGAVGRSGNPPNGYIKKYTYDDRLKVTLPPHLFDIATSGWHVVRETQCVPAGTSAASAC